MAPKLRRVIINKVRIAGIVADWKGQFGFIIPTTPINHIEATKHNGKVYVAREDLVGFSFVKQGTRVDFILYSDGTGLGAEQVKLATGNSTPHVAQQKPNQSGSITGMMATAKAKPKPGNNVVNSQVKGVTKTIQKTSEAAPKTAGVAGKASGKGKWGGVPVKPLGKFAQNTAASTKDAQKGSKKYISEQKVHGIVENWLGKFGWIRPLNPVKHPLAKGNLYCSVNDIEGDRLTPGQKVEFLVYADKSGLGADKVKMKAIHGQSQPAKAPEKPLQKKAPDPANKPQEQQQSKGKGKGKWLWSPKGAGAQKQGQPQQNSGGNVKTGQSAQKPAQQVPKGKVKSKGGAQQQPVKKTIEKKAVWKPKQQVKKTGNEPVKAQAPKGAPPATAQKGLPANWQEQWSDEHQVPYFWNKVTKESRWVKPIK